MIKCPDNETLSSLLSESLSAAAAAVVEAHVESCEPCRCRLELLYRASEISLLGQGARGITADAPIRLPSPASREFIGRLAGYDVESVLGEGGMGVVYRARDTQLGRLIAIKVFFDFPGFRRLFEREARAAAAVKDDHVVTIFHVVTETPDFRLPFIVMELIEGGSLDDRLKCSAPLPVREAATIAHDVTLGLVAIHTRDLVHRDIKPSNIMLDQKSRRAVITDFGLARGDEWLNGNLTRKGGTPGTPAYMSPEQFSSPGTVDGRSDIFSLGTVLYEMLTGLLPFPGKSAEEIALQLQRANPRAPRTIDPKIPRDLETICLVCLDHDAGHRFQDAAALAEDLRRFLNHEPILSKRPALPRRLALFARRNRSLVRLAAVFLAVAVLGVTGAFIALSIEKGRTEEAKQFATTQSKLAKENSKEAAQRKARELRTRYLFEVKDAYRAWQANNFDEARVLLDQQVPPDSGSPDLREVEWYYLNYLLGATRHELNFGAPAQPDRFSPDVVQAARFSPDGKRLAASGITESDGYCIKIWECPSFKHERTLVLEPKATIYNIWSFRGNPPPITGFQNVSFSPDGSLLAATYTFQHDAEIDGVVKVWENDTGRQVFSVSDAGLSGGAVIFSPDGRYLIAGGYDNAALVWELPSGRLRWIVPGCKRGEQPFSGGYRAVAPPLARPRWRPGGGLSEQVSIVDQLLFSPGNRYLDRVSGDIARTRWPPADPPIHDDFLKSWPKPVWRDTIIAYSPPHGAWGLSIGARSEGLRLFHAAAWKGGPPSNTTTTAAPVVDLRKAFSLRIGIDRLTGRDAPGIKCAALGTDQLAIADDNGRVAAIRFDVNTGTVLARSVPKGHKDEVRCLDFSPGAGEHLVACGRSSLTIWSNIFAPPGNRLFDNALKIKDAPSPTLGIHDVVIEVNGRWGCEWIRADPQRGRFQDIVEIYDRTSGPYDRTSGPYRPWTITWDAKGVRGHRNERSARRRLVTPFDCTTALSLSRDGTLLAVANTEHINGGHVWHNTKLDKSVAWQTSDELIPIEDSAGLPPGARVGPPDGHTIWIVDAISGKTLHVLTVPHAEKTTNLAFNGDSRILLSSSSDNQTRLWDATSGRFLRTLTAQDGRYQLLAFSPNGRWIAGVSYRGYAPLEKRGKGIVSVWEATTGSVVARFEVAMSPGGAGMYPVWAFHGNLLAVPVVGRELKIWDLEKGRFVLEMNNLRRPIDYVAFLAGGKRLLSAGESRITLWTLETENEILSIPMPPYPYPLVVEVLERLGDRAKPDSAMTKGPGALQPETNPVGEGIRVRESTSGLVVVRAPVKTPTGSVASTAATSRGLVASRFENGHSEDWYTLNEDYTRGATTLPRIDSALPPQGRNSWLVAEDALKKKEFGWHAPKEYHGDHSDKFGKLLRYSIWTTTSEAALSDWYVRLRGAGKILYVNGRNLKPPVPKVWKTYSIKLNSSGGWWVFQGGTSDLPATDQDLKEVLSDVTDLRIKGDFGHGTNTCCLDNVEFGAEP